MKLFIFISVSYLKTLILLKILQNQNLNVWLQRGPFFIFNDLLYKETDDVAMKSPLRRPLLTHVFHLMKEKLLKQMSARI